MNRTELTLAIAAALFLAVLTGWVLRWLFSGLNAGGWGSIAHAADLLQRLHEAEEAQHVAERRLTDVEGDLRARLTQVQAELDETMESLALARAQADEIRAAYRAALANRAGTGGE